ncbi:hypothetical protein [Methylocella silvestris]|uniref:hypothetical protein n=1 Tax=Methylocella silvestris TaxID=199596 RepID=UPI0011D12267|nr:hypothetical protein [Methylocella silvestris]
MRHSDSNQETKMRQRYPLNICVAAALVAIGISTAAYAAGAERGNTSSGNTATNTSTNTSTQTSTQTTTYSGQSRWADEVYAGRVQGPEARAWLRIHPRPQQQ